MRVLHVERGVGVGALTEQYVEAAYPSVEVTHVRGTGYGGEVAAAVAEGVDCVVTDHRPPLTDAGVVAGTVAAVDETVPVVVFSAAPDERIEGAAAVLRKRSGLDGLDALVGTVVGLAADGDGE
ncbi:hypothetical protein ACFQRB_07280 [Halobaculum litoreum]|uniref:Response regulatory domain-containing protein n=1 Tax=Halobaculum litoreum TaxID=3031998 RepID=A0ABD5XS99_9EURY